MTTRQTSPDLHTTVHPDLRSALSDPAAYEDPTETVELVETHISLVFLTERYVYKLKKPVRFDFLDFRTPELRRKACEEEVRLNRRLAEGVYLGICAVRQGSDGRVWVDDEHQPGESSGGRTASDSEIVDWVVKMRRLPQDRQLSELIHADRVTPEQLKQLAARLVAFYQQSPPLYIGADEYRHRLHEHIEGNFQDLSRLVDAPRVPVVRAIHQAQIRYLRLAARRLDERTCDGCIVDGHGDLRPEHIYFYPGPTIIDCIEFNSEFRQLDVLDELAFFSSECEFLGAGKVGEDLIEAYRAASGETMPLRLLDFYRSYRACVRAKVHTLRAEQEQDAQAQTTRQDAARYLDLAERFAKRLGPPSMLVVCGLSGTGKSTLADRLGQLLHIEPLSTDSVRREILGDPNQTPKTRDARYEDESRLAIYGELFRRAEQRLQGGECVILDGTFFSTDLRTQAMQLAEECQALPLFVRCECTPSVAIERISSRAAEQSSNSDATPDVYRRQRERYEPDPPGLPVVRADTDGRLADVVEDVFTHLRERLDQTG